MYRCYLSLLLVFGLSGCGIAPPEFRAVDPWPVRAPVVAGRESPAEENAAAPPQTAIPDQKVESAPNAEQINPREQIPRQLLQNVFETGRSNYEKLFQDYSTIEEIRMDFPNNSKRLSAKNIFDIWSAAKVFNSDTDLFSVISCSIGGTSLPNGDYLLSVARVNEVEEALMVSGIPYTSIYSEYCWGTERVESSLLTEGRGVRISHMRKREDTSQQ